MIQTKNSVSKTQLLAPSIFILFGVTGDLVAKKIIPSLWHLFEQNLLPSKLVVIGFARRDLSHNDLKKLIKKSLETTGALVESEEQFETFCDYFVYQKGDFAEEEGYVELSQKIKNTEDKWRTCSNKLFYLSVPPSMYQEIFTHLGTQKLNLPCNDEIGWNRILIEKPFGTNLKSAQQLQKLLSTYFRENQIYRIDHYLFKEIIQGIENFRFSNNLFEDAWDNTRIEHIRIKLFESIGVEKRGAFYDPVGTLRDVGQNHILEMLAALTMEYPEKMKVDEIRKKRAQIIKTLKPLTKGLIIENSYRAQYERYKEIEGVKSDSQTETYFALKTELSHPKWKGVPIYMESGKRMSEARKEIIVTLRCPKKCMLCEVGQHTPNKIIFRLEPSDEIIIDFWMKKPGFERVLEERKFSFFLYEKTTKKQYVEEYSKVIYEAFYGDQTLFVSDEEVDASWKFTDSVIDSWSEESVTLHSYKPDTTPRPDFMEQLDREENREIDEFKNLGIIGLGKMGSNIARQLISKNWRVVGYNRDSKQTDAMKKEGVESSYTLSEMVNNLESPRKIWLMVPHQAVDEVLKVLTPLLSEGDTIFDGGNSFYKDTLARGAEFKGRKINYIDVGVSGGPSGALSGACLMVGSSKEMFKENEELFKDLSVEHGYIHAGKSGAGHFVKMVHNGIEYGMMQSIAEGFEIFQKSDFDLNLKEIADVYNHGSVIESKLIGWLKSAYDSFGQDLNSVNCCSGEVDHSGEGEWTVNEAKELGVPATIIEGALTFRKDSKGNPSYTGQVVSALRNKFGGHDVSQK